MLVYHNILFWNTFSIIAAQIVEEILLRFRNLGILEVQLVIIKVKDGLLFPSFLVKCLLLLSCLCCFSGFSMRASFKWYHFYAFMNDRDISADATFKVYRSSHTKNEPLKRIYLLFSCVWTSTNVHKEFPHHLLTSIHIHLQLCCCYEPITSLCVDVINESPIPADSNVATTFLRPPIWVVKLCEQTRCCYVFLKRTLLQ